MQGRQRLPSILRAPPGKQFVHKLDGEGEVCQHKLVGEGVEATLNKALGWKDEDCKKVGYRLMDEEKSTDAVQYFTLQSNRYRYWVKQKWADNPKGDWNKNLRFEKPSDATNIPAVTMVGLFASGCMVYAAMHSRRKASIMNDPWIPLTV